MEAVSGPQYLQHLNVIPSPTLNSAPWPRYSGFLKFPKLPEKAKNPALFKHSNSKNLSALGGFAPWLLNQGGLPPL